MKMVWLPLGLMLLLSFVGAAYAVGELQSQGDVLIDDDGALYRGGLREPNWRTGSGGSYFIGDEQGWCDSTGRLILNSTAGRVEGLEDGSVGLSYYGYQPISWTNETDTYTLYRVFTADDDVPLIYTGSANTIADAKHVNDMAVAFMVAQSGFIVAVLVAGVAMFFALGLNVLGSGLNSTGTRNVGILIVFGGLWAVVSSIGLVSLVGGEVRGVVIEGVPVFGWIIYLFLTFIYTLGVYGVVSGSG